MIRSPEDTKKADNLESCVKKLEKLPTSFCKKQHSMDVQLCQVYAYAAEHGTVGKYKSYVLAAHAKKCVPKRVKIIQKMESTLDANSYRGFFGHKEVVITDGGLITGGAKYYQLCLKDAGSVHVTRAATGMTPRLNRYTTYQTYATWADTLWDARQAQIRQLLHFRSWLRSSAYNSRPQQRNGPTRPAAGLQSRWSTSNTHQMIAAKDLSLWIDFGRETRGVEFKGPGARSDKNFLAKVIRAALAMSNRQDGGTIVIGVEDTGSALIRKGLTAKDLATWNYDAVADSFHPYADPSLAFHLEIVTLDDLNFVVISVEQFDAVPTICAKTYQNDKHHVLQDGVIYVRPRRKPESVAVNSHADMRDLINLAVDKGLRDFLRRAGAAGLSTAEIAVGPTDNQKFEEQQSQFAPDLNASIAQGFYTVTIRPSNFTQELVTSLQDLEDILARCSVALRGWDFPHISTEENRTIRGGDFIEQSTDWLEYKEAWRLHMSGLFLFRARYRSDMNILPINHVVYWVTEAFEFAARLAASHVGGDEMTISIGFSGLNGRTLHQDNNMLEPSPFDYSANVDDLYRDYTLTTAELVSSPRAAARNALMQLFDRFGWQPKEELLTVVQGGLRS